MSERGKARTARRRNAVLAALSVAAVAACTSPVEGQPHAVVVPGTVEAAYLPMDEVSGLVGATLTRADSVSEPPAKLNVQPSICAAAAGPATASVYATGWQRFGSVSYQDATSEHVVTLVLGRYPDPSGAAAAFGTLVGSVGPCTSAVRTNEDHTTSTWAYHVDSKDDKAAQRVAWTATQDAGGGWNCARQARLTGSALVQVAVCQTGDGKQAAQVIADRFAARVGR